MGNQLPEICVPGRHGPVVVADRNVPGRANGMDMFGETIEAILLVGTDLSTRRISASCHALVD
jgi:hypothetical protein